MRENGSGGLVFIDFQDNRAVDESQNQTFSLVSIKHSSNAFTRKLDAISGLKSCERNRCLAYRETTCSPTCVRFQPQTFWHVGSLWSWIVY